MALAAAGYALLLAIRQPPVGAGDPATLGRIPNLPEPTRLPRRPSFAPASLPTDPHANFPPQQRRVTIEVTGLPAKLPATAGLAVFDDLGDQCAWLPLAAGEQRGDRLRFEASAPANVALTAAVARDEAGARRGYWAKVAIANDLPTDGVATLAAPVQDITVHLVGADQVVAGAVQLRRRGDADWLPVEAYRRTAAADRNSDLELQLGPGEYELRPWASGSWQPVVLTVPGPAEVLATFAQ